MKDTPTLVPVDPDTATSTFGPLESYSAPEGVQKTAGVKLDYGKPRTDLITWDGLDLIPGDLLKLATRDDPGNPSYLAIMALEALSDWWTRAERGVLIHAAVNLFTALQSAITGGQPMRRFPDGSVALHASFSPALLSVGEVLAYGAKKYSARNWERGIMYSRVYGAATRHLMAFLSGEAMDPETRLPHLAHAACCLMFLLTFEARGMGGKLDDRPFVKEQRERTPEK